MFFITLTSSFPVLTTHIRELTTHLKGNITIGGFNKRVSVERFRAGLDPLIPVSSHFSESSVDFVPSTIGESILSVFSVVRLFCIAAAILLQLLSLVSLLLSVDRLIGSTPRCHIIFLLGLLMVDWLTGIDRLVGSSPC